MASEIPEFASGLMADLAKEREMHVASLANGTAGSWDEYRFIVGKLWVLDRVAENIRERLKLWQDL